MKVSVLIVRGFLEIVADRGVSAEQFLSVAGIDPARLDDVYGHLDIAELDRLQDAALELTGDPALGLRLAERASAPAYDMLGYLAVHASNLRDCIETLLRYSRLVTDMTGALEEQGELATLSFRFAGHASSAAVRLRAELAVAGFTRVLQSYSGPATMPREVLFEHAAPHYRDEYTRFFGGLERFEQPITGIRFDRPILSLESAHKNQHLSTVLKGEAERLLHRLDRQLTHSERLRDILAARRLGDAPSMDAIARRLGTSVRTLRRRLAEEGVSYPELLMEASAATAKRLLEDPGRSIGEVAFEMGFSDPSAFHRAFRRWTGMTPTQFRTTLPGDSSR